MRGGLSGRQTLANYKCVLVEATFYTQLGKTNFELFDKSTFMNLTDFAESKGATTIVLALESSHPQLALYKRMFKVIGALATKFCAKMMRENAEEFTFFELEL